jgi:predicted nuclease of predicted toxin-antitoxin system
MVSGLRSAGLDVEWIQEADPGLSDEDVLELAGRLQRVLITYDTDFGDLIFNRGLPARAGVILLRVTGSIESHTARLLEVLVIRADWMTLFTSIGGERVRHRRLPEVD